MSHIRSTSDNTLPQKYENCLGPIVQKWQITFILGLNTTKNTDYMEKSFKEKMLGSGRVCLSSPEAEREYWKDH